MPAPSFLLFGFGPCGALAQQSLDAATAHGIAAQYHELPGVFTDLMKPAPEFWRALAERLKDENDAVVVWADNSVLLWDRLSRALAVNHRPDYLWPLPLALSDGAVKPIMTQVFKAVGAFEISLWPIKELYGFHHAVQARALGKLLAVSDLQSFTIYDYLHLSWLNFESVRAPDTWLIHDPASPLLFTTAMAPSLEKLDAAFKAQHHSWPMGREALAAKTRNTLAASEFVRSNLGVLDHEEVRVIAATHPYFGAWPLKGGRNAMLCLPCFGHHPVVDALIWQGGYHTLSTDFIIGTIARSDACPAFIDDYGDGGYFALLYAGARRDRPVHVVPHGAPDAAWAQAALDANELAFVQIGAPAVKNAFVVAAPDRAAAWLGHHDLFVPLLPGQSLSGKVPEGFIAYAIARDRLTLDRVSDLSAMDASAILVVHTDRHQAILGQAAS